MIQKFIKVRAATLACVLAGVSLHVSAQSTVQTYGVLDMGVEYVDKVGPAGDGHVFRSQQGTAPSRLGFRATEDLGDGLRADVVLEMGLNADTGTLANGGRVFGRTSTLGLSGPWGAVTLGRQLTMLLYTIADTEIMIPSIYSSAALDPYLSTVRADNAVAYRGSFKGMTVGAMASLGRDVVNANGPAGVNCPGELSTDGRACREYSFVLKYDTPAWGIALGGDRLTGGPGAVGGLVTSDLSDTRMAANGYAKWGAAKFTAGLIRRHNEGSAATPRSSLAYAGGAYTSGLWMLEAEWLKLAVKDSANGATLDVLRGTYSLSRRTALYAMAAHIRNQGALALPASGFPGVTAPAGGSQTAVMAGVRHVF